MSQLPKVRIEAGPSAIFTRVYIDDVEVKGVTRVWFDTGDLNGRDGPRKTWTEATRVHLEFFPADLLVTGEASVDAQEVRPVKVGSS